MSQQNASSDAGGSSTGGANADGTKSAGISQFTCPTCQRVSKSAKALEAHIATHNKSCACPDCGKLFVKPDQIKFHRFKSHGKNASTWICYIPDCPRARFGFRNPHHLITHLFKFHQGAWLSDNEQAAADSEIKLVGESSSEEEEDNGSDSDISMADVGVDPPKVSDDGGKSGDAGIQQQAPCQHQKPPQH
ncbi:hypothetical protein PG984_005165 [Apiospora sp. TS-2023a]